MVRYELKIWGVSLDTPTHLRGNNLDEKKKLKVACKTELDNLNIRASYTTNIWKDHSKSRFMNLVSSNFQEGYENLQSFS